MLYECQRNIGFSLTEGSIWSKEDYPDDEHYVRLSRKVNGSIENYCLEKNVFIKNFLVIKERGIHHVK